MKDKIVLSWICTARLRARFVGLGVRYVHSTSSEQDLSVRATLHSIDSQHIRATLHSIDSQHIQFIIIV